MSLTKKLEQELINRTAAGSAGSCTVSLNDAGDQLDIQFQSIDSLSCSVMEVVLTLQALQGCSFDLIKKWAQALSARITYLLENIGPVEFDEQEEEAILRSTEPGQLPMGSVYYEFILQSQQANRITLCRYQFKKGTPGRHVVPMQLTHEVLVKLITDLIDTLPSNP